MKLSALSFVMASAAASLAISASAVVAQEHTASVATNAEPDELGPAKSGSPQFSTTLGTCIRSSRGRISKAT